MENYDKLIEGLADAGCSEEDIRKIKRLCKTEKKEDILHALKTCRGRMMGKLHEAQRNIDVMDYLIRNQNAAVKKEKAK